MLTWNKPADFARNAETFHRNQFDYFHNKFTIISLGKWSINIYKADCLGTRKCDFERFKGFIAWLFAIYFSIFTIPIGLVL